MISFVLRRALLSILVLVSIAVIVFVAFRLVPGDIVSRQLQDAGAVSPQLLAERRRLLGRDRPVLFQFLSGAGPALLGGLGRSIWSIVPVAKEIGRALIP